MVTFGPINLSISSDQSFTGENSLLVQRSTVEPSNQAHWHGLRFYLTGSNATDSLEIGSSYRFSSRVYLDDPSSFLSLTIKENDNGGITYNSIATFDEGVSQGVWVDLTGDFIYQSYMEFIYIAGAVEGVDFYVDDISLKKVLPSVNPDDTDGDGMLDTWEQQFFPSMNVADVLPNADADGDGATNLEEFRSDTIPLNPFLSFRISDYNYGATSFECEWKGSPNKDYRVLSTTDLSSGEWSVVEEALSGSLTYTNTWSNDHQGAETKFYKVEIDD